MTDDTIPTGTMPAGNALLASLPLAVYATDQEGRITFYNEAAARFWGHRPELGTDRWCGSWRLFWPDGRPMPHEECPMAVALREGRPVTGARAIAERPDGTRVVFIPYPTPLRDGEGRVIGAINVLVDISDRERVEIDSARLAAIVSSSTDAIISKTLDGHITSWNAGATTLFGYEPEEVVGRSITLTIPPELQQEEEEIQAKLRRGIRVEPYDTVRVAKDGRRVHVSLSVSPLRDSAGRVIGASSVARDITERKRNDELQALLLAELNHRVKNTLASVQAIAGRSLRAAKSREAFETSFNGRLQALARAHDLLVEQGMRGSDVGEIVREQALLDVTDAGRATCSGPPVRLGPRTAVQLGMVLHELGTNARKHGALAVPRGRLVVRWTVRMQPEPELLLEWKESGLEGITAPAERGFGTTLIERSLEPSGGRAIILYEKEGVVCRLTLPVRQELLPELLRQDGEAAPASIPAPPAPLRSRPSVAVPTLRVAIVEDEPLIAMQMELELEAAGYLVQGPASTLEEAEQLIRDGSPDVVLLDGNLGGERTDELGAGLIDRGIPFAFVTGYGRESLPAALRDVAMLGKPFQRADLLAVVERLAAAASRPAEVGPWTTDIDSLTGRSAGG